MLGRLEYQRGNFDAALQVFQGIDIRLLSPRMSKAIVERTRPRKSRSSRGRTTLLTGVMSLHSVSLLLEAMLLKANSLAELGRVKGSSSLTIDDDMLISLFIFSQEFDEKSFCIGI